MPGSVRIARIFGIDLRIHISWLVIFGLILLQLSQPTSLPGLPVLPRGEAYLVAAITAVLFFSSVVAHELAHSLVARAFQMPVSSITLFLLGGVANLAKEPPGPRAEFLMAIAGPATSVAIGVLGLAVSAVLDRTLSASITGDVVAASAGFLGRINLSLAAFNMIPGFPLDGGRVFRSIVWGIARDRSRATRIAARGGQAIAGLLLLFAVWLFFDQALGGNALWIALIAYFLYNAASSSLEQERVSSAVAGVRVGSLMSTQFRAIHPRATVADLVDVHLLPHNARAVAVVDADRLVGIVTIADLRRIPREAWGETRAEDVMRAASELPSLMPSSRLITAIERFGATDLPVLPVVEDGALVGMLEREAVGSYVRMREMLGLDARR